MRKYLALTQLILMAFTLTSFNADGFFSFSKIKDRLTQSNPIKIVTRTCATIQRNYYDQKRINPTRMMEDGLHSLARTIPEMLVTFPKDEPNKFIVSFDKESRVIEFIPPVNIFDILDPLSKAFQFINTKYEGDLPANEREYEFIRGMLRSLDPHSNLLTPTIFKEFKTATKGEYGGIGIVIGMKEDDLSVISPIEDTPAQRAGLEADDKIREIDHVPTVNMQLDEAVELLRGIVNTKVNLLIERKKQLPFNVTLTREKIVIRSVKAKLERRNNQSVAIISIRSFQEETFAEMVKALTNFSRQAPIDNIILDFRNNPGGLLDQSIEIADKFLAAGTILYSVGAENGQEEVYNASFGQDLLNPKIIVLVNEGSASASEIVAGALKNNNRVVTLGIKTFGKGSVQSIFNLQGGAAVKLTIAQYLTPGRISIQAVGITPDIAAYPRLASNEFLDLKKDESYGEENLDSHLVNAEHIKQEKPVFELNFLQAEKKTEESAYVSEIDPLKDYTLNLAMDLITKIKSNNRLAMLNELLPLLVDEQKKQEESIAKALQTQGIVWGLPNGASPKDAKISLKAVIKKDGQDSPISTMSAGDKIRIELSVKNEGASGLDRVLGVIKSENPLFDEKELLLGRLEPGQEKTTFVPLTIPLNTINIEEKLRVVLFSQATELTSLGLDTKILAEPKATLAYQFDLVDNGRDGTKGNSNSIPEKGETIALKISIFNLGDQPIKDVQVNIKNLEGDGIYLKEARSKVDIIPAGKSKEVVMLFDVNGEFSAEEIKLDLTISEKDSRFGLSDRFHFPALLGQKDHFDPLPAHQQIAPRIKLLSQKLVGEDLEITGQVTDDTLLKDLMIYLGPKKVFYQVGPKTEDKQAMPFTAKIQLEKGANVISIQARDNRKLTGYETLSVVLPKDQALDLTQ